MSEEQLGQAHQLLGTGRIEAARQLFARVRDADGLNGLGLCAEADGDLPTAEAYYRQALAQREEAEYLNNLAICLQRQGKGAEALQAFRRLAELRPEPAVLYNLALALSAANQLWEAISLIRRLLLSHPQIEAPVLLLLELIERLGQNEQTLKQLQLLQAAEPDEAVYQLGLAAWYDARGYGELAVRYFRGALRANPALLGAYRQLIFQLQTRGRYGEALKAARQLFARELSPQNMMELLAALQHPIPTSEAQVQASRREVLALLEAWNEAGTPSEAMARPVSIPFYFSYQSGPDKVFQQQLAAFYASCLQSLPAHQNSQAPERQISIRPRLGVFSTRLYRHSVTDLLLGAIETLFAAPDFETWLCFCPLAGLGGKQDEVTARLKQSADHSLCLPEDVFPAASQLAALDLDLLIFLDVGMDAYSYALALKRLARFQLVLPGHPVTTGMPTSDYFISAAALEIPSADDHYREKLIRLPGLPDYLRPVVPPPASRDELGLPAGHLYFCPMTIFKIQPAFDSVLAGILAADPDARVLLLEYKHQLHLELQGRFAASHPPFAERLHFLPWSPQPVFYQRLRAVDVILDTFPFGGGNTSYQALGLGCPIVC
ncbi:MAG TPA: tetratricopeptide repeat protein, partial [Candidatus Obscuribacterales bacterium]